MGQHRVNAASMAVRGRPYRAGVLAKVHGHGRRQPLSADGPWAGAVVQGQGDDDAHLRTQGSSAQVTPAQVTPRAGPVREAGQ